MDGLVACGDRVLTASADYCRDADKEIRLDADSFFFCSVSESTED